MPLYYASEPTTVQYVPSSISTESNDERTLSKDIKYLRTEMDFFFKFLCVCIRQL